MHHIDSLEPRRLFAGGTVDPTFGNGGAITLRVPVPRSAPLTNDDSTKPIKLLPDAVGRTLYVARSVDGLTLGRLTSDGQVDTTFAGGQLSIAAPGTGTANDVVLDPAGRIDVLAEGQLSRLTQRGRTDRTFATDGVFGLYAAGWRTRRFSRVESIATDSQGRLVGLATGYNRTGRRPIDYVSVAFRLTADGALDSTFGDNGTVTLDSGDAARPLGSPGVVRVLTNDSAVIALASNDAIVAFRFTAVGKADSTYGTKGRGVYDPGLGGLSLYGIRADGRVDAVGTRGTSGQKAPGNHPAALDISGTAELATNGRSGRVIAEGDSFGPQDMEPLATEADGAKWVYDRPFSTSPARFSEDDGVLYRLKADGTRDRAFNKSGGLGSAAATVAADGSILVAVQTGGGNARTTGRITIARYFAEEGPLAFAAPTVRRTSGGVPTVSFNVLWRDDDAIDRATLDNNDVILSKGSTTLTTQVLSRKVRADGRVLVNYAVAGPGGTWDAADSGTYAVATKTNAVKDPDGVGNTGRAISTLAITVS